MTVDNPNLTDEERDRRRVWQVIRQWRIRPPGSGVVWQEFEDTMVALMGEVRTELKECRSQVQGRESGRKLVSSARRKERVLSRNS